MRLAAALVTGLLLCCATAVAQQQDPHAATEQSAGPTQALTAEQVVARMRDAAHVQPFPGTVDTFKAGDPTTVVTGVAVTITPTMDVLRKAVADGDNFVITHEPTFYNHEDAALFPNDPVYLEKLAYIRNHKLVVFRFHDGEHQRVPDFTMEGWAHKVGWTTAHRAPNKGPLLYSSAPVTVAELARQLEAATGAHVMRVVGDPNLQVTKLAFGPGAPGEARQVAALERDDVEVLIAGEIPEWETISYVWDAAQQGRHKAMILVGHYTSEAPGSEELAAWLRTVLPGVRVEFIAAAEPYVLVPSGPA